jgi:hypothetical protein
VRAAAAVVVLALLALSGCETTAEKSAQLEKSAHHTHLAEQGLSITRQSRDVHVLGAILLRGTEASAAVVSLQNSSARTLRNLPIAITVKDAHGSTLFQNNAPGLEAALTSLALLPAHARAMWVDDQVQASAAVASVSAIAGVAPVAARPAPQIEVQGVRFSEEGASTGAGASGTVRNRSAITQQSLVVYVVARRSGNVVAAGRAVLPEVGAGASVPFQAFLVGTPRGAQLEASAPPTTLG